MAALLKVSTRDSDELRATVQALKLMDRTIAGNIRKYTKSELAPEWQKGLNARAGTALERQVLANTARVSVSNQNVMLKSATVGRTLAGGLSPKEDYAAVEFGADRSSTSTYRTRSRKGKPYTATRHTRRPFKSPRRGGYVVYPTAGEMIPRFASLWVQITVRLFYEAFERK